MTPAAVFLLASSADVPLIFSAVNPDKSDGVVAGAVVPLPPHEANMLIKNMPNMSLMVKILKFSIFVKDKYEFFQYEISLRYI